MSPDAYRRLTHAFAALGESGAFQACAISVCDLGGHALLAWRGLDIGFYYVDLASAKAWTAAALRRTPDDLRAALGANPAGAAYLTAIGAGRFAPLRGSILLLDAGTPCCALGVAGPAGADHDEKVIGELAERAGFKPHRAEDDPS